MTRYMIQVNRDGSMWSDTSFIFESMLEAELFALTLTMKTRVVAI